MGKCEKFLQRQRCGSVQGHIHKIVGGWFQEHTAIRDEFNRPPQHVELSVAYCQKIITKLEGAAQAVGRDHPVPKISDRKLACLAREEAISGAKREQDREDRLVVALEKKRAAASEGNLQQAAERDAATLKRATERDAAALEKGEGSQKEAQAPQKRAHSGGGPAHPNGSVGVEGGAVATADATIVATAAACTADAIENGLTTSVTLQMDQNCTPLHSLVDSRKQARLIGSADGGAS